MTAQNYQELIRESIEDLPADVLAEIADFVLFVRRRALQPAAFADEIDTAFLQLHLRHLSRDEEAHLEEEFENYEQRYARE